MIDHARAIADVVKAGIDCYVSEGTAAAIGIHEACRRVIPITAHQQFSIGTWSIMPFDTVHDAAQPLGFLLSSSNGGKVLYATDTAYLRYKFTGLTHILIGCNYEMSILDENVASGSVPLAHKRRIIKCHMSLGTLCDFLQATDLDSIQEIHLLHGSDSNLDKEDTKRQIQCVTGKPIYVH